MGKDLGEFSRDEVHLLDRGLMHIVNMEEEFIKKCADDRLKLQAISRREQAHELRVRLDLALLHWQQGR